MYAQVLVAYAMYIYKSNNLEALTATNMYLSQALRLDSKKSKEQFLLIKQSKRDSFAKDSPEVFSKFVQK
jgi:hypothetical protein